MTAKITTHAPTEEEAQELAEKVEDQAGQPGDHTLKIRADHPPLLVNRSVTVSYEITAPRRVNVLCQSDYGSLKSDRPPGNRQGQDRQRVHQGRADRGPGRSAHVLRRHRLQESRRADDPAPQRQRRRHGRPTSRARPRS